MLPDLMSWWTALGDAERLFLATGLISNFLFLAYVALQLLGGHDSDLPGHDTDTGFTVLSVRSLLAFGMFLGWTGLVVIRLGGSWTLALLAGIAAGLLAVWLAYHLLRFLLRLQEDGTMDILNAVGQTAAVHLVIPAHETGPGKVMVEVQGALRELDAVTEGNTISTGETVRVIGLKEGKILMVEPI